MSNCRRNKLVTELNIVYHHFKFKTLIYIQNDITKFEKLYNINTYVFRYYGDFNKPRHIELFNPKYNTRKNNNNFLPSEEDISCIEYGLDELPKFSTLILMTMITGIGVLNVDAYLILQKQNYICIFYYI